MSNSAKLKKKAAEFEQKKQFDKALALYIQVLESPGAQQEDVDVALFNRVGDLLIRQGDIAEALNYYEKAVDHYAEGGFFNNAIALCNKILRQSPGRTSIYYKLGKISAQKGFKSDAKQNFLEYADRMQRAGQMDEAFRALKEFADLCPDQDDIRLMLAEQLKRRERKGEALEQLQTLYDKLNAEGRSTEARATVDRIKAIDPSLNPQPSSEPPQGAPGGLVFLDVSWEQGPSSSAGSSPKPAPAPPSAPPPRAAVRPPIDDLPLIPTDVGAGAADVPAATASVLAGLEPTSLDPAPLSGSEFAALPLPAPADNPIEAPAHDLALPGELPPLEMISADPLGGSGLDFDFAGGAQGDSIDLGSAFSFGSGSEFGSDLSGGAAIADAPEGGDLPLLDFGDGSGAAAAPSDAFGGAIEPATLDFMASQPAGAAQAQPIDDGLLYLDAPPAPAAEAPGTRPSARRTADSAGASGDAAFLAMMSPPAPTTAPELEMVELSPTLAAPSVQGARADSVEALRELVARDQSDWALRRRYAEALLEKGEREGGMHELEQAMIGFERADDLEGARSVADEIIRINPSSVRHHQKRVEYAFRTNDKARLCDAYLQLADALFRTGQAEKSRAVYKRVIDLNPGDVRAQAALSAFVDEAPPAAPAAPAGPASSMPRVARPSAPADSRTAKAAKPAERPAPAAAPRADGAGDGFVNLGELLRDDAAPKSTRMVVEEQEPTGDEQADFADMLRKFKQGVAENVDEDDHESHYDLGVAYKEMGLLDEAISEFQKALRAPGMRVRTYEALGQCFMEKRQLQAAATVLERAVAEPGAGDEQLVGVLYLLGYAYEAMKRPDDALAQYHRVFAVDIQFRDVGERLAVLERVAR